MLIKMTEYIHVLAGKPVKIGSDYVPHHQFGSTGLSLIEKTLATARSTGLPVMSTVWERERVTTNHEQNDVYLLEARGKLLDNFLYGLIEGILPLADLPPFRGNWGRSRDLKKYVQENPAATELAVLYVSADVPFLQPRDFSTALEEYARLGRPDVLAMMTKLDQVEEIDKNLYLQLSSLDTTLNNCNYTDDGRVRISNMYVIKPFRIITSGLAGSLQKIYEHRKISEGITSWLGAMSGLIKFFFSGIKNLAQIDVKDLYKFTATSWLLAQQIRGRKSDQIVGLSEVERLISSVSGLEVRISAEGGLSVLDVDDEDSLRLFQSRYNEISAYLETSQRQDLVTS